MFEGNLIIKASAGTGKTFSLATRFIRLMLFDRVAPERIIALTFSRAAAQEIYTKILERLWEAADGDPAEEATEEKEFLLGGRTPPAGVKFDFSRGSFARLLRALVDTQHKGAISTLDSFILRIVGNFPQEMGFQNAVEVLDGVGESDAVDSAVAGMMGDDAAADEVAKNFKIAKGGQFPRTCIKAISDILNAQGWRDFVLANGECAGWTLESMAAALGVDLRAAPPDMSGVNVNSARNPEAKFIELVRTYGGDGPFVRDGGALAGFISHFVLNPAAESYTYTYYGKTYTVHGGGAIRAAVKYMTDRFLARQLEIVVAKIRLAALVENEYHRTTRRRGRLTFRDFTDYSAASEGGGREIALRNLEYRFDARFDHWTLDEFQDTSEVQWRCLRRLVRSAAGGDAGRSVLAVGDQKQSIYTWRGASRRPFDELISWPEFAPPLGEIRSMDASHRYGRMTADFVNRVFGPSNPLIAADDWKAAWPEHVSESRGDYVKVVAAAPDANGGDGTLAALCREVRAVWSKHAAAGSTETVGILVRSNDKGAEVAEGLRAMGLPVVWEGMNRVHDLPVVQGVLDLLRLSAHPEDSAAWNAAGVLMPLAEELLPGCGGPAEASAKTAGMLSRQGLARTMKVFCTRLADPALGLDSLTCERLRALVRLAVAFERRASADSGVDAFVAFLERSSKRELGVSPDVIRVLTIHRSKGLTFDRVFVPLFEDRRSDSSIDTPKRNSPLFLRGEPWVLPHLPAGMEMFNERTRTAHAEMRHERLLENLRTYYVAFTRARKATYIVFPDAKDPAPPGKPLMRDLVSAAAAGFERRQLLDGGEIHGELVYEAGVVPDMSRRDPGRHEVARWTLGAAVARSKRASPSRAGDGGDGSVSAESLFAPGFGAAARRGVDAHSRFAEIEWADDGQLARMPAGFRAAFVKPSPDATVWRERPYESFSGGTWESGRFDRVVFGSRDGVRFAVIYDYKTNARRAGETPEAFAGRMRGAYRGQMAMYRRALSRLTGLDARNITAVLLLEAAGLAAEV